jgi:hypothetical protein
MRAPQGVEQRPGRPGQGALGFRRVSFGSLLLLGIYLVVEPLA